jgi:hypothetical protein
MDQTQRSTASVHNRRASRRLAVTSLARIEFRKGALGLGPNLHVNTLDLSENGIRLVVRAEIAPGQEGEVLVGGVGLSRAIKRIARVVWVLPLEGGRWIAGLHFDSPLPYAALQRLGKSFR